MLKVSEAVDVAGSLRSGEVRIEGEMKVVSDVRAAVIEVAGAANVGSVVEA